MNPPTHLIDFLEQQLGTMAGGQIFESEPERRVQVARFENQPVPGSVTYVTTGLSKHFLHQVSGPDIKLELLACVWSRFRNAGIDALLFALSQEILSLHHAPAHGDVIGPRGPVTDGSKLEAFYILPPLYYEAAMEVFESEGTQTLFAWALPISVAEASFIRREGWKAFEERIHSTDPDLMDLERASIVS
jgi:hypothetical protein